jgi:glycosyltransferase involved in cell wall biosynthesis
VPPIGSREYTTTCHHDTDKQAPLTYLQQIFIYTGAAGWLKATLARPDVAGKYSGILNGIDTQAWDPATDPFLPACYSPALPQGKALCKEYLQRAFGMTVDPSTPLVAVISRLVPQKGIHLIEHAAARTLQLGRVMDHCFTGWVGVFYKFVWIFSYVFSIPFPCAGGQFVLLGTGHADGGLKRMANETHKCGLASGC